MVHTIITTTMNQIMITNAIMGTLPPIHQLADWPIANAVMMTAIAVGLKICFFPIARTYFDAIANIVVQIRRITNERSVGAPGVMMSARMSAVIYADSTFGCALKICARMPFVTHAVKTKNTAVKRMAIGL